MPGTFDDILNVIMPILVIVGFCYILYKPLKEPLSGLGTAIKNIILKISGRDKREEEFETIEYQ